MTHSLQLSYTASQTASFPIPTTHIPLRATFPPHTRTPSLTPLETPTHFVPYTNPYTSVFHVFLLSTPSYPHISSLSLVPPLTPRLYVSLPIPPSLIYPYTPLLPLPSRPWDDGTEARSLPSSDWLLPSAPASRGTSTALSHTRWQGRLSPMAARGRLVLVYR